VTKIYRGWRNPADWSDKTVTVDENPLKHIERHSPDGFEWGYGGSGPSDLALSILTDFVGEEIAKRHYQDFKWSFVSKFEENEWILTGMQIEDWLRTLITN
jgi:hypothetical protein